MLLRTRVTLIVSVTYSLLVVGLTFAGLKSEELADERYAQATLNGQETFWRKLVENTVQRLESYAPTIDAQPALTEAVGRGDPAAVLSAMAAASTALRARPDVTRWEVINRDGELLFSSRGSLLDPPIVDAGTVRTVTQSGASHRGIIQDASKTFTATVTVPLRHDGAVVGAATLAADLHPPLEEFKTSTGSDIFLVDRNGQLALGTSPTLWTVFRDRLEVRKSRLETWQDGGSFLSVAILPLQDGSRRVIGALVTVRDVTETQARQRLIRQVSIAAVVSFLFLVLGIFYLYMRRSFNPLEQAIQVLNALSRGDTSVTLDVENDNDEIGRIARTVGVFRENAIKLNMLEARRERQRRRQELFIRLQMQKLSEMLEEDARQAVLLMLKRIEAMGEQQGGGETSGKGELDVLAVAFQTMSDRIREQHESLQSLISERTRDVEILREALRTRDQLAALRQELDFARELQLSSLPQIFPPFPDRKEFEIHAAMIPAKEVGGDFYDFFLVDRHHLAFVIGDASGKGVPAAMFIAIARSLIKAVAPLASSPGECLAFVNTMLSADNPQTLFATCFYAVLDTRSGAVSFCNAGHPPPLILRADGTLDVIRDVSGVALGVLEDLEYETGAFQLGAADQVLLYTDGVTEATDTHEKLFEEYRLIDMYGALGERSPEQVIADVEAAVAEFVGDAPQFDDITMLALRFVAGSKDVDAVPEPKRRLTLTGFSAAAPAPEDAAMTKPPAAPPTIQVKAEPVRIKAVPVAAPEKPQPPAAPQKLQVKIGTPKLVVKQPPKPIPRLDVTISNDLAELERLAGLVDGFIEKNNLPDRLAFNLNLCLDELITNTVSYGFDDGHQHDIHLVFSVENGKLITRIEDEGRAYDPFTQAPEPDLDADVDDRPIGGLGVFLVKEFMDQTEYRFENGRNIVTLWKSVDGQES